MTAPITHVRDHADNGWWHLAADPPTTLTRCGAVVSGSPQVWRQYPPPPPPFLCPACAVTSTQAGPPSQPAPPGASPPADAGQLVGITGYVQLGDASSAWHLPVRTVVGRRTACGWAFEVAPRGSDRLTADDTRCPVCFPPSRFADLAAKAEPHMPAHGVLLAPERHRCAFCGAADATVAWDVAEDDYLHPTDPDTGRCMVPAPTDQPAPSGTSGDVWLELIGLVAAEHPELADLVPAMAERRRLGIERYGTPLRRGDGRDEVRDAEEEAIDLAVYFQRLDQHDLALQALRLYRAATNLRPRREGES